jgi:hypothetical protein
VVETVFSNTFCFSPVLALLGFQGLVAFAVNVIPGEPVRMRIVETTETKDRQSDEALTVYNIHPAVRDGFVQGIGRDVAAASHGAIRTGLEVFLGDAPVPEASLFFCLTIFSKL